MRDRKVGDIVTVEGFLQYRITGIRYGGMACVYLLESESPIIAGLRSSNDSPWQPRIAAKTFLSDDLNSQFEKELNVWVDLHIQNVVPLRSVTKIDGRMFALMPQYACSLQDVLKVHQHFESRRVLNYVLSACLCLRDAFGLNNVLHLDLKPSNLLLLDRESTMSHVSDWGISFLSESVLDPMRKRHWQARSLIETNCAAGTLPYMSPDRLLGRKPDHRDDIFSVGLIMCQLAAGTLPTEGVDERDTVQRIMSGEYLSEATAMLSTFSSAFTRVVARCIAPARSSRYSSYDELLSQLKELLRGNR